MNHNLSDAALNHQVTGPLTYLQNPTDTEQTPCKKFDQTDPETIEGLKALVQREQAFFDLHKVQKRSDGSYWVRLAVQPTQDQLTHGVSRHSEGLIHNRGELVNYIEQNLEMLRKRDDIPLCFNRIKDYLDGHGSWEGMKRLLEIPFEYIYGYVSNIRIKDYGTHKEAHAEFKPLNTYKHLNPQEMTNVCPALAIARKEPYTWTSDQVSTLSFFHFERDYSTSEMLEMYSDRWLPQVKQSLAK